MNLVEEIKNRVKILDVVRDMGKEPNRQGQILSIYNDEKHPSLMLYPKSNSYYCYSKGKGGSVIDLYMDYYKISFKDAIKELKDKYGINENTDDWKSEKNPQSNYIKIELNEKRKTEIYHSLEKFCGGVNEKAFQYLTGPKRGLTEESLKRFKLFSINNFNETIGHLLTNYKIEELKAAGLFNDNGRFVFAKHHLIIPYLEDDKIIYMRGRIIPENDEEIENTQRDAIAKYIGLAGQPAKRLFNISSIKNLNEGAEILLCEGEFDAMRAAQEGYKAIGIPGVNNFPSEELLKIYEIFICLDNDKPGKEGMQKVTNQIGKSTVGLFLKKYKDITDYFNQTEYKDLKESEFVVWQRIEPERKSKIKLVSAREIQLMELPPIRWIIKDLLPEGLTILAGRPKVGKSFIAQNISLSVSKGAKALGYFDTDKSYVLYIALEDNFRRIKDRMHNIMQLEIDKTAPENLYYLRDNKDLPKLNDGGIEELQKLIDDNPDIKLIIVDTFGRCIADKRRKDNNSYRADYEIASNLQVFAIQNHICVMLLHHTKKIQEDDVFNEISGTSGITGAMDTMFVLKKKGINGKLYVTGRDVKDIEYNLIFEETICSWNIVEDEIHTTKERKEIFELIDSYNREMRTGEIAELLNKTTPNISKMLTKMVKEGVLKSKRTGYYYIPEELKEKKSFTLKQRNLFNEKQSGKSG